VLFT